MGYGWPRGLRRRSAAGHLLRLWFRIPPGAWMSVCCECCVLPSTGLCEGLITRPEESYWLWCVIVCDLETSWMRPWPTGGLLRQNKKRGYGVWNWPITPIYCRGSEWVELKFQSPIQLQWVHSTAFLSNYQGWEDATNKTKRLSLFLNRCFSVHFDKYKTIFSNKCTVY